MKTTGSLLDYLLWSVMCLCLLIISLLAAWHLLATQNFHYSTWYDVLSVGDNIKQYGPLNVYKQDFHRTDKAQHVSLFAEIVKGIQHDPDTLSSIRYRVNGRQYQLLHEAELIHLRDVHHLVQKANRLGLITLAVTLLLAATLLTLKQPFPDLRRLHLLAALLVATGAALLLVFGAKDVFYRMHVWLFPEDHQWFFYYEESLMSTLMKAPLLFGGIALELLVIGLVIYSLLLITLRRLWPDPSRRKPCN